MDRQLFRSIDYYPTQYATFEKYYPIIGQNSLSGKVVREFCEDEDGNLWIGTEDGGLNKFNPKTKEFSPCPLAGLHYNVHALSMDNHTLWIGTYSKGLYSLDLKTHRSRHYLMGHAENTLNDNNIYSMCRTSAGQLYIGTTTRTQSTITMKQMISPVSTKWMVSLFSTYWKTVKEYLVCHL